MAALVALLVLVSLFIIVARVASIALVATGVARDVAVFQARSAMLGVGFTTTETEDLVTYPQRRRIILWLMTLGNAGIVTGIGSFLLTFINAGRSQTLARSALFIIGLFLLLVLLHTKAASSVIERGTTFILRRYTDLDTTDWMSLLRIENDYAVTEIHARAGEWMVDRPLKELQLTHEGVLVLGIHRADGTFLGVPTGETNIHVDDLVLAYGRTQVLADLAVRRIEDGDEHHTQAMRQQLEVIRAQAELND